MKILMLGWELPPYNSGGLGVACYQLAKALASHGADIQFVLPSAAKHDNPDFMRVLTPQTVVNEKTFARALNPYTGDIEAVRALQNEYEEFVEQLIEREQPDVIHAHDWLTFPSYYF